MNSEYRHRRSRQASSSASVWIESRSVSGRSGSHTTESGGGTRASNSATIFLLALVAYGNSTRSPSYSVRRLTGDHWKCHLVSAKDSRTADTQPRNCTASSEGAPRAPLIRMTAQSFMRRMSVCGGETATGERGRNPCALAVHPPERQPRFRTRDGPPDRSPEGRHPGRGRPATGRPPCLFQSRRFTTFLRMALSMAADGHPSVTSQSPARARTPVHLISAPCDAANRHGPQPSHPQDHLPPADGYAGAGSD